ncbi:hypothetical protein QBC46DRAFT_419404 [Diplogelasinospora grovesii]|uniref:DUF221-domain-containing protein n=1 Tax=Diplogelasinospora grovesii TaxID=303347 RepID=A0AAN6N2W0_9PEZI|nr:hypothetical protein QBC46DRAFT_419404 [Diplogelasinospora grovesii]
MSSTTLSTTATATSSSPAASDTAAGNGVAQTTSGMSLVAFLTALATSLIVFGVQMGLFLLLRNKLARIFKPKTYLVPERERTEPPPASPWSLVCTLMKFSDREIIKKCGLDAYFFLRYLQTLLVIFIPIAFVVIPILIPINYVGGLGRSVVNNATNTTDAASKIPTGLDTLAWGNVAPKNQSRRWAHLVLALLVIVWVCGVFFAELRVYVKVRQDYLTSAEHRLRASANTVLVSSIPEKWLTEEALRGLFDVFPGGIRNIWLTRDFAKLLEKIHKRDAVHQQLEAAETDLIREAKRRQLKHQEAEAKKQRKASRVKAESKAERAQRQKAEDDEAQRRADGGGGLSVGDHEQVPHNVSAAVDEADDKFGETDMTDTQDGELEEGGLGLKLGGDFTKLGHGLSKKLKKGVAVVGGAGQGILGGAKIITQGVDGELERTGGFDFIKTDNQASPNPLISGSEQPRNVQAVEDDHDNERVSFASNNQPRISFASDPFQTPRISRQSRHAHTASGVSQDSEARKEGYDPRNYGNTTRKVDNIDDMYITEKTRWYQFWKPPSGGYASPVPQGAEGNEYPWKKEEENKTFWQKVKSWIPFMGGDEDAVEYPPAYTRDYTKEPEEGAEWEKWLKPKDRPHHRLPLFEWTPGWLPGLPLINKKVDTIYYCRGELARLNLEIEEDQKHPERYPVMNSAFIQFNNQVAAHMACQSVTHHVPKRMDPRMVEISPTDVIWDNMAITWWDEWARSAVVFALVGGMIILWAFPVAWTATLSQIDALIKQYSWLGFLQDNPTVHNAIKAVAGVLPAIVLSILLALVPVILDWLAEFQGSKTGSQKSEVVQVYYFVFLFVQVFLVVSIAAGTWATIASISTNITSTPNVLAENLPKAANYFFTYMILQALSTSSGTLLQVGTLFVWYILSRLLDNTARAKWTRNTQLPNITWGSFFPVYTNFACIALIYSIVAPLISIFAIITFSLLWAANRYNMLYVTRFRTDTGGVLYPRAINQTFTGLYVMELCLVGLFFLAQDESGSNACIPQAIIMVVAIILTALYQFLLNSAFGPLLRYLPITFEDEAVLRDEAFQRAQDRRLGLTPDDDETTSLTRKSEEVDGAVSTKDHYPHHDDRDSIELRKLSNKGRSDTGGSMLDKLNPVRGIKHGAKHAGNWAARSGKHIRAATFGKADENLRSATHYRKQRRQKDLEAQRAIGDALYGGYHDEIEDLTPEERDALVRKAFQHYALRARRPTVWIPRDDIGVSDDEIRRTREFSEHIWISNEGTALDSKVRVVYGRNPPDFSEVDIISL